MNEKLLQELKNYFYVHCTVHKQNSFVYYIMYDVQAAYTL